MAGMPHHVRTDPAKFLSSFEYEGSDGCMKTVEPWQYGERIAHLNEEQEAKYRAAWDLVDEQTRNTRVFIASKAKEESKHVLDQTFDRLKAARGKSEYTHFSAIKLLI
jgi:hypothetical protein